MIVLLEQGDGLRMRRVRPWDRLTARLRTATLDRALAAGASPESSVTLAVHAQHLHNGAQRSVLARSLRRVGASSEVPSASKVRTRATPLTSRGSDEASRAASASSSGRARRTAWRSTGACRCWAVGAPEEAPTRRRLRARRLRCAPL